jgi:hypothetical protein
VRQIASLGQRTPTGICYRIQMTHKKKEHPYCFGKLDTVFPLGKDGLRHTPESCMVCFCKTECLKTALKGPEGITVEEERVKRAYGSGTISFIERWSQKKALERQKKKVSKKRQD